MVQNDVEVAAQPSMKHPSTTPDPVTFRHISIHIRPSAGCVKSQSYHDAPGVPCVSWPGDEKWP